MIQPQAVMGTEAVVSEDDSSRIQTDVQDELGKDAFFELLITQLRHQDPIEPMDNTEFISQMAQFSSLEQMQNMNEGMKQFLETKNIAENASLIGKFIEVNGEEDEIIQGEVRQIIFEDNEVYALLDDDSKVSIEEIDRISES